MAKANQLLIRHNIILGVDDRGKLSCQKTHLCFIYFDTSDCVVSETFPLFLPINITLFLTCFISVKFRKNYEQSLKLKRMSIKLKQMRKINVDMSSSSHEWISTIRT